MPHCHVQIVVARRGIFISVRKFCHVFSGTVKFPAFSKLFFGRIFFAGAGGEKARARGENTKNKIIGNISDAAPKRRSKWSKFKSAVPT